MLDKFLPVLKFFLFMIVGAWGLGMSEPVEKCVTLTCFQCRAGVPPTHTAPVTAACVFCGAKTDRKVNFPVAPRHVGHRGDADTFPE